MSLCDFHGNDHEETSITPVDEKITSEHYTYPAMLGKSFMLILQPALDQLKEKNVFSQ